MVPPMASYSTPSDVLGMFHELCNVNVNTLLALLRLPRLRLPTNMYEG
jgi:hypothetical protein